MGAAAGLDSDKSTFSNWIGDNKVEKTKPVYFPEQEFDPVTQIAYEKPDASKRDKTLVQGAAGVGSARLTSMNATTFIADKSADQLRQSKMHKGAGDLIAHTGPDPEKHRGGLRKFHGVAGAFVDSVHIRHKGDRYEDMAPEDVEKWTKMKQVRISGDRFIYNVAGHEDLLPGATQRYTKADRPPSRSHRAENDKRWLPKFFRKMADDTSCPQKSGESEDMAFIMGQSREPALGESMRFSMASVGSEEGRFKPTRQPPSDGGRGDTSREMRRQSTTPPRGYTPPGSYAPSEGNYSIRSMTPPGRFSPPARSQGSGSVYSMDRGVWSSPNQVTMGVPIAV